MQQIQREADLAEPEQPRMTETAAHVRRKNDGEAEELGANRGPEATEFSVLGRHFMEPFEKDTGPLRPGMEFGGK